MTLSELAMHIAELPVSPYQISLFRRMKGFDDKLLPRDCFTAYEVLSVIRKQQVSLKAPSIDL